MCSVVSICTCDTCNVEVTRGKSSISCSCDEHDKSHMTISLGGISITCGDCREYIRGQEERLKIEREIHQEDINSGHA